MTTDPTLHHHAHALPWELPEAPTNDRARRDAIPAPVSDEVHRVPAVFRRVGPNHGLLRVVDAVCESIDAKLPHATSRDREIIRRGVVDGVTAGSVELYCDLAEEVARLRGYLASACEIVTATMALDMLPSSRVAMSDAIAIMRAAVEPSDPDRTRR